MNKEQEIERMLKDLEAKNPLLKMFGMAMREITFILKAMADLEVRIIKLEQALKDKWVI